MAESARLQRCRNGREELPSPRSGAVAERSYPASEVGAAAGRSHPMPETRGSSREDHAKVLYKNVKNQIIDRLVEEIQYSC